MYGEERRGVVHDENCAALGGVAGHAGLFGTAAAAGACARWWLTSPALDTFARKSDTPGSSRALGWDTMLPTSSCGSRLSARAIGHTGFTGTSLWIDPGQDLYVVFLSNRVHPSRHGDGIQETRRALHDAVVGDLAALDALAGSYGCPGGRWPIRESAGRRRRGTGRLRTAGRKRSLLSAGSLTGSAEGARRHAERAGALLCRPGRPGWIGSLTRPLGPLRRLNVDERPLVVFAAAVVNLQ